MRYRELQGHLTGAMVQCCASTWQKEPIVFPYLNKVLVEKVDRISMKQDSELELPTVTSAKEVPEFLRKLLNSYFRIYLSDYLYAPPC